MNARGGMVIQFYDIKTMEPVVVKVDLKHRAFVRADYVPMSPEVEERFFADLQKK